LERMELKPAEPRSGLNSIFIFGLEYHSDSCLQQKTVLFLFLTLLSNPRVFAFLVPNSLHYVFAIILGHKSSYLVDFKYLSITSSRRYARQYVTT
jgi:hypothetical protein